MTRAAFGVRRCRYFPGHRDAVMYACLVLWRAGVIR